MNPVFADRRRPRPDAEPDSVSDRTRQALLLWAPFSVLVARFWCYTPDDAFIPLRYAWHLRHGQGLVFNPGERVEGFTSPLHALLSLVPASLPFDRAVLWAKLLSLLFAGLALVCARTVIDHAQFGRRGTDLALLLTSCSWTLAYNAANAMETSLAAFVITLLVLLLVRSPSRSPVLVPVVAVAAVLSRPEMLATVVLLGAASIFVPTIGRRGAAKWCIPALLGVAVTVLVRFAYYGDILPNTFHAKRLPGSQVVDSGFTYLWAAIQPSMHQQRGVTHLLALAAVILTVVTFCAGSLSWSTSRSPMLLAPVAVIAQCLFVVGSGGDWMQGGRFLAPVAPLMAITQVAGVIAIGRVAAIRRPHLGSPTRRTLGVLLITAALAGAFTAPAVPIWNSEWRTDDRSLSAAGGQGDAWARGPELFECARPGDLVAYSEMGFAPWERRDLRFLDTRGLLDRAIATGSSRDERHTWGVGDPAWTDVGSATVREVLRRRPTIVATYSQTPPRSFGGGSYITSGVRSTVAGYTVFRRSDVTCQDEDR